MKSYAPLVCGKEESCHSSEYKREDTVLFEGSFLLRAWLHTVPNYLDFIITSVRLGDMPV